LKGLPTKKLRNKKRPHSVEKRENPRKNWDIQLIVNPVDTPYLILGWVRNISLGGIMVKNSIPPSPFAKEEEVRFSINEDDLVLNGDGKVVWTLDMEAEMGIKFTQVAEEMRRSLEKFLGALS
jgi:hypothetical protein